MACYNVNYICKNKVELIDILIIIIIINSNEFLGFMTR